MHSTIPTSTIPAGPIPTDAAQTIQGLNNSLPSFGSALLRLELEGHCLQSLIRGALMQAQARALSSADKLAARRAANQYSTAGQPRVGAGTDQDQETARGVAADQPGETFAELLRDELLGRSLDLETEPWDRAANDALSDHVRSLATGAGLACGQRGEASEQTAARDLARRATLAMRAQLSSGIPVKVASASQYAQTRELAAQVAHDNGALRRELRSQMHSWQARVEANSQRTRQAPDRKDANWKERNPMHAVIARVLLSGAVIARTRQETGIWMEEAIREVAADLALEAEQSRGRLRGWTEPGPLNATPAVEIQNLVGAYLEKQWGPQARATIAPRMAFHAHLVWTGAMLGLGNPRSKAALKATDKLSLSWTT